MQVCLRKLTFLICICLLQSACVTKQSHSIIYVKPSCKAEVNCFERVQDAIDAAPDASQTPVSIFIAAGSYREKIVLLKSNLRLIGDSQATTRIVYDDYAGKMGPENKVLGTPGSASFKISATNIRLENLSIENTFDYLQNDALAANDPHKIVAAQAVALFIDSPSDKIFVRNVRIAGNQDSLFINSGRSWFDRVLVEGNVDYIFGNGNALFTHSEIKTLARGKANTPHGFITAPSTQVSSTYGFTFYKCRLTREKNVPNNSVALGRPWHPTAQFSDGRYADPNAIGKSVFIESWMDAHVMTVGWHAMSGTAKDGQKIQFPPESARFYEYKNSGEGAKPNEARRQLPSESVADYARKKILGDWAIAY